MPQKIKEKLGEVLTLGGVLTLENMDDIGRVVSMVSGGYGGMVLNEIIFPSYGYGVPDTWQYGLFKIVSLFGFALGGTYVGDKTYRSIKNAAKKLGKYGIEQIRKYRGVSD